MYGCASVDRLKVDRTARYSILRIVQESHCRSGSSSNCISTSAYNIDSKTSSNSDKNSNLFDGCTARTDLVHFANVNSVIINKSSKNELNMDNVQEMNAGHRGLSSLDIYDLSIKMMLSTHGCCILGKFFRLPSLETVKLAFKPLVKKLKMRYDEISDEFDGLDDQSVRESLCISRCPRIGKGKHNIHLDPLDSPEHRSLSQLLEDAHLLPLLTAHTGSVCSLRETGLSLTKPSTSTAALNKRQGQGEGQSEGQGEGQQHGEGMEWHSDGSEGEFTMLMSLSDISSDMGCLKVVPCSHLCFKEGVGHGDIGQKDFSAEEVSYAYRAGEAMLIDARTIHSVSPNISDKWRVVLWCIFDSY